MAVRTDLHVIWKNAARNPFYQAVKQQLTVRLDADVVAWLRRNGKGYQTRLKPDFQDCVMPLGVPLQFQFCA